ncbi:MAG: C40 family peptidase [Bacteroidota bacterium]|nr:C40 family peptidase [Bacteroidota bacterium]
MKSLRLSIVTVFLINALLLSSCFSSRKVSSKKNSYDYKEYSHKLGIPLKGNENPKLIAEISRWMGTPYMNGGCTTDGTDCSCLVCNLYRTVYGISLERSSDAMAKKNCKKIIPSDLKEGDLVFFSSKGSKVSHVGLYLHDGYFVHATTSKGVMVNNLNEPYYQKYFTMGGRVIQKS